MHASPLGNCVGHKSPAGKTNAAQRGKRGKPKKKEGNGGGLEAAWKRLWLESAHRGGGLVCADAEAPAVALELGEGGGDPVVEVRVDARVFVVVRLKT